MRPLLHSLFSFLLPLFSFLLSLASTGCRVSLSPLANRISVGEESYAVFTADGEGGVGDLYAIRPGGGTVARITWTRLDERAPALDPSGVALAFIRTQPGRPASATVWVMNLLNGAERRMPAPIGAPPAARLGWTADGSALVVRNASGESYLLPAPPAEPDPRPVDAESRPAADSALLVVLGTPAFAVAAPCATGIGLCVMGSSGKESPLAADGRDPFRWGADSVGYFVGETFVVRPLGAGSPREVQVTGGPVHPRELVYFDYARR